MKYYKCRVNNFLHCKIEIIILMIIIIWIFGYKLDTRKIYKFYKKNV